MVLILPLSTAPMEARSQSQLPQGRGWQFEPKWDGFRCLCFRDHEQVYLLSKSGRDLGRFFPEIVHAIRRASSTQFVIDGELIIAGAQGSSFSMLQSRLHPAASRIALLSQEIPASYKIFDLLAEGETSYIEKTLAIRRPLLESFAKKEFPRDQTMLQLSPKTTQHKVAMKWLEGGGDGLDGVMAKSLDHPYRPGARDAMIKVKQRRTADCVVGGFRYAREGGLVGSLLLGLHDEQGLLHHVGFTSNIPRESRGSLTRRLEQLRTTKSFSGRTPGKKSRWSTASSGEWEPVKPVMVVEVAYTQVSDGQFRHGTSLVRWRRDKKPSQCTLNQMGG